MENQFALIVMDTSDVFAPIILRGDTYEDIEAQLKIIKFRKSYVFGLCFKCSDEQGIPIEKLNTPEVLKYIRINTNLSRHMLDHHPE
jgi:hypothetical protein